MDRFSYWQGSSGTSLRIVKYLETYSPETAIAPQLVMRKARVMKNRGDLQGMGRLLSVSLNKHPSYVSTPRPQSKGQFSLEVTAQGMGRLLSVSLNKHPSI